MKAIKNRKNHRQAETVWACVLGQWVGSPCNAVQPWVVPDWHMRQGSCVYGWPPQSAASDSQEMQPILPGQGGYPILEPAELGSGPAWVLTSCVPVAGQGHFYQWGPRAALAPPLFISHLLASCHGAPLAQQPVRPQDSSAQGPA